MVVAGDSGWKIAVRGDPNLETIYLYVGGSLIVLIGSGCGLGAYTLWNGTPKSWSDVVATETVVRRTARVLAAVSIMLSASGAAIFLGVSGACEAGAVATLVFVAGGFLGNYKLFGDLRPKHTVTNGFIAIAVLLLLWNGCPTN